MKKKNKNKKIKILKILVLKRMKKSIQLKRKRKKKKRKKIYYTGLYIEQVKKHAKESICPDRIVFLPQSLHIHDDVLRDGMFVSSSDYEGMSNSMLEAMAIGLPTICTDCPAGGARAVIKDHENGILTPVGDVQALAAAMVEVADDPELAKKLSENGVKVREQLSTEKIVNQWIELIDN